MPGWLERGGALAGEQGLELAAHQSSQSAGRGRSCGQGASSSHPWRRRHQVRSVLKTFGFVLGKGRGTFVDRVSELLEGKRLLLRLVRPLLRAWEAIRGQLQNVDKEALTIAAKG